MGSGLPSALPTWPVTAVVFFLRPLSFLPQLHLKTLNVPTGKGRYPVKKRGAKYRATTPFPKSPLILGLPPDPSAALVNPGNGNWMG